MVVVRILLGAALVWVSALGLGAAAMRRFESAVSPLEAWLYRFLVGSALLSCVLFWLCTVGMAYLGVLVGLGALGIAFLWRGRPTGNSLPALEWQWATVFWAFYALYTFYHLPNALAPETSPDASTYHLGEVRRYVAAHGFTKPTGFYSALSQGMEMLYVPAYAVGRHSAAKMVHWGFLEVLPLLLLTFGQRIGSPVAGVVAALFLFFSPVAGDNGTIAYVDLGLACTAFGLFAVLEWWRSSGDDRLLWIVGLLAGFAYSIKLTAAFGVVFAVGHVFWYKRTAAGVAVVTAGFLIAAGPWIGRDWMLFHNPVAPFFNTVFPNAWFTPNMERELRDTFRHQPGSGIGTTLFDVLLSGTHSDGYLGPMFLLLPVALLAWRRGILWRVLLAGLLFGAGYATNVGARFLLPALPFLALAIGLGLSVAPRAALVAVVLCGYLCWPSISRRHFRPYLRNQKLPWAVALRRADQLTYLRQNCSQCLVAQLVEANTPPDARIFTFGGLYDAYHSREAYAGWMSTYGLRVRYQFWQPVHEALQARHRMVYTFPRRKLRAVRVAETAVGDDPFSVSEIEWNDGKTAVPLKLADAPFQREDAHLAIDGNRLTRWHSHRPISPGLWFTAQPREPAFVDRVTLWLALEEGQVRLRLEGQDESGAWHMLSDHPEDSVQPELPDLRQRASQEIRKLGITHFLFAPDDLYAKDYNERAAEWGLTLVAKGEGVWLYRVQ